MSSDSIFPWHTPGTSAWQQENAGAAMRRVISQVPVTATAAGGDGTYLEGAAIQRADPAVALSAVVCIPAHVVLASGDDVVFTRAVQHRDTSADAWVDAPQQPPDLTITALPSGAAQDVEVGFNYDLSACKAQIKVRVRPNFSASSTDTAALAVSVVLAGFDTAPPPAAT